MTVNITTKVTRRTLLAGASSALIASRAWAQQPSEVKVGLLVPISGMAPVEEERATPEALEAFLKAEVDKWGRIIKAAGIDPQ